MAEFSEKTPKPETGNDFKAPTVAPSQLIRPGGRNFASMSDASQIGQLESSAPAFHRRVLDALKASGKVRNEDPVVEAAIQGPTIRRVQPRGYRTGAPVKDKDGRKLTIIKASAGFTKKNHIPVHRVSDSEGNSWLEKETNLKLRM